MILYEGISVENNTIKFNWDIDDEPADVIKLNTSSAGQFTENNVSYIYGYCYTDTAKPEEKRAVRTYLKNNPYDENVEHFIETALFQLNHVHPIELFNVVVTVESETSGLVDQIETQLLDQIDECTSLHLIKELYDNIKFNQETVIQILKSEHRSDSYIKSVITKTLKKFNELKASKALFEMKQYLPTSVRFGFEDFLTFKTEEDKQLFMSLQGANVLVIDDFLTSGATVKEIIRYLNAINPTNKLTVFILVNQRRS